MFSDKMNNISHCAVIHYLGLKGSTPKEIHEGMVVTLGKDAPSYNMVKKWDAEFKCDKESLEAYPCPRRPIRVTTQETMAARRVMECYAATELGISQ